MRVYTKCPCCSKTIFLVMEMELGSNYGLNYQQQPSNDWQCLNSFLECLTNSQGNQAYLGLNEREGEKIPKEFKELILKWTEKGYQKPEKEETRPKPAKTKANKSHAYSDKQDWKNISLDFAQEEYQQNWVRNGFNYEQTKGWVDIGLGVIDAVFCAWLRDTKHLTPEWCLNHGNMAELREEFESSFTHREI